MTKVKAYINKGKLIKIEIEGHAGFAKKGYDIICCSISTSIQLLHRQLQEYSNIKRYTHLFEAVVDEQKAYYSIELKRADKTAISMMKTTLIWLKDLEKMYPIYILTKEVNINDNRKHELANQ